MKLDESVYMRHIIDAIARIEEYLHGVDEETFRRNHLIQDGVIRQVEIIGEAAKRLSPELRSKYPHIPGRISQGCETSSFITTLELTSRRCG